MGFPCDTVVKNSPASAGDIEDMGSIPGSGNDNPLQYSCLENLHGHRSLVGYGPWDYRVGHDCATEHTHTNTHIHTHINIHTHTHK